MIRNIISLIMFIVLSNTVSFSQTSPDIKLVYLGLILVDEISADRMAKVCEEYDLMENEPEDGFLIYTNNKEGDAKLRFKVEDSPKGTIPIVQVISKEKPSVVKKIITENAFTKSSDGDYYNGTPFAYRRTKCHLSPGSPLTVTFTKVYRSDD